MNKNYTKTEAIRVAKEAYKILIESIEVEERTLMQKRVDERKDKLVEGVLGLFREVAESDLKL